MPPRKSTRQAPPPPAPEEVDEAVQHSDGDDIHGEPEKLEQADASASTSDAPLDRAAKMKQLRQRMVRPGPSLSSRSSG